MKRLLCIVALLALAAPASAQVFGKTVAVPLMSLRDSDSVTFEYCVTTGVSGRALDSYRRQPIKIKTVGSSTTVSAQTAGTKPFLFLSEGDEITVNVPGTSPATEATDQVVGTGTTRVITVRTDDDTVTVNSAIDLSIPAGGFGFLWRKLQCGTAATDGWVQTRGMRDVSFSVHVDQINTTTGVTIQAECENVGATSSPISLWAQTYTTATDDLVEFVDLQCDRMRVGVKMTSTDDGVDTGAAAEQISFYMRGRSEQ
jgi:hypothetical protein